MKRLLRKMARYYIPIVTVLSLLLILCTPALGATTADVTVTFTPEYLAITDNATSYGFGTLALSSTTNSSTLQVAIDNTSTVQTDHTIAVVTDNWTGGTGIIHDNTGTPGADTVAMKACRGAAWLTASTVVVETLSGSPNYIYEDCPATTDFTYGLSLLTPTSVVAGNAVEQTNTVRITVAAG